MSTWQFRRPARRSGPAVPDGAVELQEPPELPQAGGSAVGQMLMFAPMALGSGAMMLIFLQPGVGPTSVLAGGLMGVSAVGMLVSQLFRGSTDRKHRMKGDRRDYLRHLAQERVTARKALTAQHAAATWLHPHPGSLWSVALSYRLWERRPAHDDFGEVRLGVGPQRAALRLDVPDTKPVEDLEPLAAHALRRFLRAYRVLPRAPIAVFLRGVARVRLRPAAASAPDDGAVRAAVRALLAQLAVFHAPDDLRVVVGAGPEQLEHWDWVKWLPHAQDPSRRDAAGAERAVATDVDALLALLDDEDLAERPRFEQGSPVTSAEPFVVVVLDGLELPEGHRLGGEGLRNVVVLDVAGATPWRSDPTALHLEVAPTQVRAVGIDRAGRETSAPLCTPDALGLTAAAALARSLAPWRLGSSVDTGEPMAADHDLSSLLGIADPRHLDLVALRTGRTPSQRLRVPLGLDTSGVPVEIDLKESAEAGMGPHGMLVGATGSGKSELLRTLVLGLAATHPSEQLNFVLADFKGGAAFLGFDQLPHTSAVITNLADELDLVDRMSDALTGEMTRRQELLRLHSQASRRDYERARQLGAPLEPLPALLIVVDEFSEMLVSKPDFIDVFASIGRLGRSLGVHLLLASQRLDEGRISKVETHLSYRLGLRTFSAAESRAVIGVPDAYELPATPGSGYLRSDQQTLTRFKAAYVSGTFRGSRRELAQEAVEAQLVPFGTARVAPRESSAVVEETPTDGPPTTLMDVMLEQLRGHGAPAHQVWLPPLRESPPLDELLPPLLEDPELGVRAVGGGTGLQVPMGLVDLPEQQRRELLVADLAGAQGHVAVVGGPQSGKSTMLRTLVGGLALRHGADEVQFYCLDFGGGALGALAGLPHVGGVTGRLDRDRVVRTVLEVAAVLARREQLFAEHGVDSMAGYREARRRGTARGGDPHGDVFLVIDGWYTLRQDFEDLEAHVQEIASRGLGYGVHLVIAASRWSEMRSWLRDVMGTRFELKLGDPIDSEVGSRLAATVPAVPGRGLTRDKRHFLAAVPRIDGRGGAEDLQDALADLVDAVAGPGSPVAPPVRVLPAVLDVAELPAAQRDSDRSALRVPLGLDDVDLAPLWHDFDVSPHLVVFGDTETGKTTLLRHLARSIAEQLPASDARIVFADSRRELHDVVPADRQIGYSVTGEGFAGVMADVAQLLRDRVPGPEITPEQLRRRDWWSGGRLFVLVDDLELLDSSAGAPLHPLLPLLPHGADIGLHLVVVRSTAGGMRAMGDPVLRRLWDMATPAVLFSCPRDEGTFLGDVRPRLLPTGRAQFISRRRSVRLLQTPLVPAQLEPTPA